MCRRVGVGLIKNVVIDDTYQSIANTSIESFDRVFGGNTHGAFLCTREVVAALRPRFAAYTAAKAAVELEMFFGGSTEEQM
ncbi:hypothetical protein MTR_5g022330 [Medicago truncatula]|uniref:Uncharacterized protein n=1 Tax=Medicago truncatula TaxID=3880 RepID=G7JW98_MEDTR|nr:hypothetical protein MTR_5g022330 [Medicago truncatula]